MKFYQTNTQGSKATMHKIKFFEEHSPHALPNNYITTFNMTVVDDEMLKRGRPYYQIYPEVFEAVSNTTLDLDIEDWKVPFDIFEIRVPKTEKPLIPIQKNSSLGVTSIQIFRNFYKRMMIHSDEGISSTYKYITSNQPEALPMFDHLVNHTAIKVNIFDYSDPENISKHHSVIATLGYQPATKIKDIVSDTIKRVLGKERFHCDDSSITDMSGIAWSKTMKLALGVSLLATSSQKILEYDVLAKQLEAYQKMQEKGDESGCRNIERKARKKGKFGWNIGKPRARRLPLSQGNSYGNNNNHKNQHRVTSFRCGHWHKYYVGKGRKKVAINWVNPTVVRPDLCA